MLTEWNISEDYSIKFDGTKAAGTFQGLAGTIIFDENDLVNSKFDVSVQVNTISTGNKRKDGHAKGESWFNAEEFPTIEFESSSFLKTNTGYEVEGDLTLRGVTKQIGIPFVFTGTESSGLFEGTFTVNREDYGIEGSFGAFLVGDDFEVTLKVPVGK